MIQKIWDWLDGNKSLFGLAIMYFVDQPGDLFGSPIVEQLGGLLGAALLGGGMLHKFIKGTKNTGK